MMKTSVLVPVAVGCLSLSAGAWAQGFPTTDPHFGPPIVVAPEGPVFGNKGQKVLSSDFQLDVSYDSIKPPRADAVSVTEIRVAPALDWFIANNLSVGGMVGFEYLKVRGTSAMGFSAAPAAGFNIPMTTRTSFFPKLGAGYQLLLLEQESPIGGSETVTGHRVNLFLSAPVLFHPVPHFFVGVGPLVSVDVVSKIDGVDAEKHRRAGVHLQVGGWW